MNMQFMHGMMVNHLIKQIIYANNYIGINENNVGMNTFDGDNITNTALYLKWTEDCDRRYIIKNGI